MASSHFNHASAVHVNYVNDFDVLLGNTLKDHEFTLGFFKFKEINHLPAIVGSVSDGRVNDSFG